MIELVLLASGPQVTGDQMDVTGTRMATSEQLTTNCGIFGEAAALQLFRIYGRFVIVELADQVVTIRNCRPAEERVRLPLHRPLAFRNALALMGCCAIRRTMSCGVWRVG